MFVFVQMYNYEETTYSWDDFRNSLIISMCLMFLH